jgi:hypothetical protein
LDLLAPYAVIDTFAIDHIVANKWQPNKMYTPKVTRARFAQNAKTEKFSQAVINKYINLHIFRNHTIAVFLKKAKKTVKQNSKKANKILGQLGCGRSKTTSNSKSRISQSKSKLKSRSKTPNSNISKSTTLSNSHKEQKQHRCQNQNQQ